MKKFKFNINDENLQFLENVSKDTHTPKSKILNTIIHSFIQNPQNQKNNKLDYVKEKTKEKNKEVRLFFTQNEFNLIKEAATKNNHSFVTQECRFRILNSIYNDKFSSGIELRQFILTTTAINRIGINLNQLNRELRKRSVAKINEKNLDMTLKDIIDKIDTLTLNLVSLTKKSQDKIL